jgi:sensor histidine kinase regulating citrate/malate metabolism
MDHNEAFELLKSKTLSERLAAARYFSKNATTADIDTLTEAKNNEKSAWVLSSLESAISFAMNRLILPEVKVKYVQKTAPRVPQVRTKHLYAKALEEVSGTILHEFGNVISSIMLNGPLEFENYDTSETCKQINQLVLLTSAIKELKKVSTTPTFTEFNISQLIDDLLHTTREQCDRIDIRLAGEVPFMVRADYGQLLISVGNGLRNAIEAVTASSESTSDIVINWGTSASNYYLVILDTGIGFKGDPADALKMGRSTKSDHIGFGLTTAQQAIESMDGSITVSNIEHGASFEVRWVRENENTNS